MSLFQMIGHVFCASTTVFPYSIHVATYCVKIASQASNCTDIKIRQEFAVLYAENWWMIMVESDTVGFRACQQASRQS